MKKFTDGEWVIDEDPLNYGLIVKCNGNMVARAHSGEGIPYTEKAQQNARLIKSAPRMYDFLVQLQVEGGLGVARHRQIGRIIAEANGKDDNPNTN